MSTKPLRVGTAVTHDGKRWQQSEIDAVERAKKQQRQREQEAERQRSTQSPSPSH
jgi:hypothetical protein